MGVFPINYNITWGGGSLRIPNLYHVIYVTHTFKSFCNLPGKKTAKKFTELFDNPISLKEKFLR